MSNNNNANSPAFPCVPIQDNFGRLIAAIPGMTKLEYVTIQIFISSCPYLKHLPIEAMIKEASGLLQAIEEYQNKQNNEENTETKILPIN